MTKRSTYSLSIPPSQVRDRLASHIDTTVGWQYVVFGLRNGHPGIVGRVTDHRFSMANPRRRDRDPCKPVLYGTIQADGIGSIVRLSGRSMLRLQVVLLILTVIVTIADAVYFLTWQFDAGLAFLPCMPLGCLLYLMYWQSLNAKDYMRLEEAFVKWFRDVIRWEASSGYLHSESVSTSRVSH